MSIREILHAIVRAQICLLLIFGSTMVSAQNNFDLSVLNPGEILVNLHANEQAQAEQDTLHASLNYVSQGRDRVALQNEVNQAMAEAVELLADSELEFSTQLYRVYQIPSSRPTRGDAQNLMWNAQQSVAITSQDSAAVLDMVARLQELGLTVGGLNYSLSPSREEEVADTLLEAALDELRNRAEATAAILGKSGFEIVELSVNSSNSGHLMGLGMAMSMSTNASIDVATPVAEPGLTTVTLNVSARVILLN